MSITLLGRRPGVPGSSIFYIRKRLSFEFYLLGRRPGELGPNESFSQRELLLTLDLDFLMVLFLDLATEIGGRGDKGCESLMTCLVLSVINLSISTETGSRSSSSQTWLSGFSNYPSHSALQ